MAKKRIDWSKIRWGSLTRWLKKHRLRIMRKYGDPFVIRGGKVIEINDKVLQQLYNDVDFLRRLSGTHWKHMRRKIQFKLKVLGR